MKTLYLVLYIVAAVLFGVAAIAHAQPALARVNLVALGLLAWVLVPLIQTADAMGD
jgi:hypothetical protein